MSPNSQIETHSSSSTPPPPFTLLRFLLQALAYSCPKPTHYRRRGKTLPNHHVSNAGPPLQRRSSILFSTILVLLHHFLVHFFYFMFQFFFLNKKSRFASWLCWSCDVVDVVVAWELDLVERFCDFIFSLVLVIQGIDYVVMLLTFCSFVFGLVLVNQGLDQFVVFFFLWLSFGEPRLRLVCFLA